jgi:hypothetical protein
VVQARKDLGGLHEGGSEERKECREHEGAYLDTRVLVGKSCRHAPHAYGIWGFLAFRRTNRRWSAKCGGRFGVGFGACAPAKAGRLEIEPFLLF